MVDSSVLSDTKFGKDLHCWYEEWLVHCYKVPMLSLIPLRSWNFDNGSSDPQQLKKREIVETDLSLHYHVNGFVYCFLDIFPCHFDITPVFVKQLIVMMEFVLSDGAFNNCIKHLKVILKTLMPCCILGTCLNFMFTLSLYVDWSKDTKSEAFMPFGPMFMTFYKFTWKLLQIYL